MSVPVILDPEAQDEFDEGYDYYENRQTGLGELFADAIQAVLEQIAGNPELHRKVFGDIRRAVIKEFPSCVDYREETSRIRVLAVFHARRNPKIWKSRL